jgi:hypothetical protein
MERGKRGQRFSIYIGDKSPEEQAFWDAAEEHSITEGPKQGKIKWAELWKYICRLIYNDRQRPAANAEISPKILEQLNELERRVKSLEDQKTAQPLPAESTEGQKNELAESADRMAGEDW